MSQEMKDIGIDGVEVIPEGWGVARVKDCSKVIMGQSPEADSVFAREDARGIPFAQGCSEFGKRSPEPIKVCLSPKKIAHRLDVLLSVRAPVGRVNLADKEIAIGRGLCALSSKVIKMDQVFMFYLTGSAVASSLSVCVTGSTFEAVSISDVANVLVLVPPLAEQKSIADFLDRETALIDKRLDLIEKKRGLLSDLKKSVIHEAVTKGLDRSVVLKGSGVDWVGEMPQGWAISRVKSLFTVEGGSTPASDEIDAGFPIPWATPADFGDIERGLCTTSRSISVAGLKAIGGYRAKKGEILISGRAPVGKVALMGEMFSAINQGCKALRRRSLSLSEVYYFYVLVAAREEIEKNARGTTFLEISSTVFSRIALPQPPLKEQIEIAEFLDSKINNIESMVTKLDRQVDLLKEQREALIHEVVTGKRRVI